MSREVTCAAQILAVWLCVACMRMTSTPEVWPCKDSGDCEDGETCWFSSSSDYGLGECRPSDYHGSMGSTFGGQGGMSSNDSTGNGAQAGSLSLGGGPVQPGRGGSSSESGGNGEIPLAGTAGSYGEIPLGGAGGTDTELPPCGGGLLPRVDNIAPAVMGNRVSTIIIRGAGFTSVGGTLRVSFGDTATEVVPDSDTQITFETPAIGDGPKAYAVNVSTEDCPGKSDAQVFVMDKAPLAAQAIEAPSTRERLVFDGERRTLYAVNRSDQQIERYHEDAGSWTVQKPLAVPELMDVAMGLGGRSLLAISKTVVFEIDLTAEKFAAKQRAVSPDLFCGNYFYQLAVANDGNVLIVPRMSQCSGFNNSFTYSSRDQSIVSGNPPTYDGNLVGSYDGSRIFFGGGLASVSFYSALTSSFTNGSSAPAGGEDMSVSGNASRVIMGTDVRSGSLSLTGKLPAGGVALAAIDSTRAFVFRSDDDGAHLVVHDLEGVLEAGALYPVQKTIDLAQSVADPTDQGAVIRMTSTPDDSAIFISGPQRILVVPVN